MARNTITGPTASTSRSFITEAKSFTFEWTAPDVTTLEAVLNDDGSVTLKGLVKDKGEIVNALSSYYPYGYYGIEYSNSENFDKESTIQLYPDRSADNMDNDSVVCIMTPYGNETTCYYRTFFNLLGIENHGEKKSFKSEMLIAEAIDLGLSVKWASFNLGASTPEGYGHYFAWGEVDMKSGYSWSNYKYCNGSSSTMTKYCNKSSYGNNGFTDTKTTLDLKDDAAHVSWGGSWRIPTKAEIDELLNSDNCTWTRTAQNGVNGYLVTSKITGHEGASIFLPAAGCYDGTSFNVCLGFYWTSSLSTSLPFGAYGFCFGSDYHETSGYDRSWGLPVRPVCP
jgi:hypothetical protein